MYNFFKCIIYFLFYNKLEYSTRIFVLIYPIFQVNPVTKLYPVLLYFTLVYTIYSNIYLITGFHNQYDHTKSSYYKPNGTKFIANEIKYNLTGYYSYENISVSIYLKHLIVNGLNCSYNKKVTSNCKNTLTFQSDIKFLVCATQGIV